MSTDGGVHNEEVYSPRRHHDTIADI